jgi:hypothetical protein
VKQAISSQSPFTTRSEKLFASAFTLAVQGKHRASDEILELAHVMREQELSVAYIAQHAPSNHAVLLVKSMGAFNDDTDPVNYVEANRESIKFYAENDIQLRSLIVAVFNPQPYKRDEFKLTANELMEARQEIKQRHAAAPNLRAISDDTITPACIAAKKRGFTEFLNAGGGSIMRECPDCKNKYSTKVQAASRIYWHCPHCNAIK